MPSSGLCGCLTLAEPVPDPLSTDCACSPGSRPAVLLSLRTLAGASLQLHAFRLDSFGEEKWKAAKVRWENCSFSTRGDFIRAQLQLPGGSAPAPPCLEALLQPGEPLGGLAPATISDKTSTEATREHKITCLSISPHSSFL